METKLDNNKKSAPKTLETDKISDREVNIVVSSDINDENSKQEETMDMPIVSDNKEPILKLPITKTFILTLNQIKMICTIGVPMTVYPWL